jgi:hypothetical protein
MIPSKVWTYFVQEVAGNGQAWHHPKITGKLPSPYSVHHASTPKQHKMEVANMNL